MSADVHHVIGRYACGRVSIALTDIHRWPMRYVKCPKSEWEAV